MYNNKGGTTIVLNKILDSFLHTRSSFCEGAI